MALNENMTTNEVCSSFNTGKQVVERLVSSTGKIENGAKLFYDEAKTLVIEPNKNFGWIDRENKTAYRFSTDSNSIITNLTVCKQFLDKYYQPMFPIENVATTKTKMMQIREKGVDNFQLNISPFYFYKNLSSLNNDTPFEDWGKYEELLNYVCEPHPILEGLDRFTNVSLRICLDPDDSDYYFQGQGTVQTTFTNAILHLFPSQGFEQEWEVDIFGYPARIKQGSGHASLGSPTGRAKTLQVFEKTVRRAYAILGSKLVSVKPTIAATQEFGFNFEGGNRVDLNTGEFKTTLYRTIWGYNPSNIASYQDWFIQRHGQGNLAVALNYANSKFGTTWTTKGDIQPPRLTGLTPENVIADSSIITNLLKTERCYDFMVYNNWQLLRFLQDCKEILRGIDPNIKLGYEVGAIIDNLSPIRCTIPLKSVSEYVDIIKSMYSTRTTAGQPDMSADFIKNNTTLVTESEFNMNDPVEMIGATPTQARVFLEQEIRDAISCGLHNIHIIDSGYMTETLQLLDNLKTFLENPTYTFTNGATIDMNYSDLMKDYATQKARYLALNPVVSVYTNRPKINLIEDVTFN